MIALRHVLVPTDFGQAAEAALAYGRTLARMFGADLHLLHVMDNTFFRPAAADPLTVKATAYRQLQARLTPADCSELHARATVEVSDDPDQVIVEYAHAWKIGLIVMGTHGRQGAAHVLMGSVAERVVRKAPCPVLTVRQPEREFVVEDAVESVPVPA
jgi:universal stress protein A